jgi:hypothetical protein
MRRGTGPAAEVRRTFWRDGGRAVSSRQPRETPEPYTSAIKRPAPE